MRGEAGLHRRCNPGEGEPPRIQLPSFLRKQAPHPNPLSASKTRRGPVRTARGRRDTGHVFVAQ
ncbi:hypothetical protein Bdiaspc4_03900 [Bradyrhizobium diazoefficiens]|nr:hypothetical protein Bdiaspc4_03900 [Bradyrhizobium diazoefficiens]